MLTFLLGFSLGTLFCIIYILYYRLPAKKQKIFPRDYGYQPSKTTIPSKPPTGGSVVNHDRKRN